MGRMETVDIKGKDYVPVNERLKAFRQDKQGYSLTSEIVKLENGECIIKAIIADENGNVVATGHAAEKESSSFINKTSYIENCETSAWGRALGNFGYGIDTNVASAEEVLNAVKNQEEETKQVFKKLDEETAEIQMLQDKISDLRMQLELNNDAEFKETFQKKYKSQFFKASTEQLSQCIADMQKKLEKKIYGAEKQEK